MFAKRQLQIDPAQVPRGKKVHISYQGPLASSPELYLHHGFDGWINPKSLQMSKTSDASFEVSLYASGRRELEFCFHDGAGKWDNNQGLNWHCPIS